MLVMRLVAIFGLRVEPGVDAELSIVRLERTHDTRNAELIVALQSNTSAAAVDCKRAASPPLRSRECR